MLGGQCNRTATGPQTCPQHTKAGDYRTRVSLNSQRTVSGLPWIPRLPLAHEHSLVKLAAGKLTSSSPTDTAGITSATAILGLATCQHRKLQDDSRTVRIQAPRGRGVLGTEAYVLMSHSARPKQRGLMLPDAEARHVRTQKNFEIRKLAR